MKTAQKAQILRLVGNHTTALGIKRAELFDLLYFPTLAFICQLDGIANKAKKANPAAAESIDDAVNAMIVIKHKNAYAYFKWVKAKAKEYVAYPKTTPTPTTQGETNDA